MITITSARQTFCTDATISYGTVIPDGQHPLTVIHRSHRQPDAPLITDEDYKPKSTTKTTNNRLLVADDFFRLQLKIVGNQKNVFAPHFDYKPVALTDATLGCANDAFCAQHRPSGAGIAASDGRPQSVPAGLAQGTHNPLCIATALPLGEGKPSPKGSAWPLARHATLRGALRQNEEDELMQPDLRKQLLQQAAMVKQLRKLNRKAPYRRSKLEAHRDSITLLHQAGYSTRDITFWLCLELHQKVHHSTVARALTRWAKDG